MRTSTYPSVGLALLALLFLTGCGRAVLVTTVHPDGTWERTDKFFAGVASDTGPSTGITLDKTFELPKGGRWKTSRKAEAPSITNANAGKPNQVNPQTEGPISNPMMRTEVYTAVRACRPGEVISRDVALRSGDSARPTVQVANSVTVRSLGNGRWEYRETLQWVDPAKPPLKFGDLSQNDPELTAAFKKVLPVELATPTKVARFQERLAPRFWRLFFGPGDPLLAEMFSMIFFPDTAERKLKRRFSGAIDGALAETYGNALTVDRRHAIARQLADMQTGNFRKNVDKKTAEGPPLGPPGSGNTSETMTALTFVVQLPGRIVETNGDADPVSGEVSWSLYSPAVQAGEITLRAVCDTKTR
ncbi:MAG: hypothetical protein SFU56_07255 [Capsulimonadales bacterium]|nr:hypothetical protein [Capsulimonadales bacterium]